MGYTDYRSRIDNVKQHIEWGCTGNADEFSKKIGVSRRTLFNYFETLKMDGLEIKYCRIRKTYYFVNQQDKPKKD